jgi:hypothetical protein
MRFAVSDWKFEMDCDGEGKRQRQRQKQKQKGKSKSKKAAADPSTATRAIAPYTAGTHDSRFAMEEKARASPLGMTGLRLGGHECGVGCGVGAGEIAVVLR